MLDSYFMSRKRSIKKSEFKKGEHIPVEFETSAFNVPVEFYRVRFISQLSSKRVRAMFQLRAKLLLLWSASHCLLLVPSLFSLLCLQTSQAD